MSTLLLATCSEEKAKEDTKTPAPVETVKENEVVVDMAIANDKSIPLEERIK
ncbi:hypothetical protein [Lysinibacillus sp. ZYM-1]|uniref:hypothetical protein n=1 Tax=Lysinibacillus sp. ZYM-1 TaxID=1681184 RepID=UPI0012E1AF83|nr:hypothetical protein [Lysinibacillus sp. ZYM-1]